MSQSADVYKRTAFSSSAPGSVQAEYYQPADYNDAAFLFWFSVYLISSYLFMGRKGQIHVLRTNI